MAKIKPRADKNSKKKLSVQLKPQRKRKNSRRHKGGRWEPQSLKVAPHSFVIKRGKLGRVLNELMLDYRKLMEPFTASKLKTLKKNSVRDFVSVASLLNVTHMIIFTRTQRAAYLRLCRLPRGPTLTYKIVNYTLVSDVVGSQRRPYSSSKLFANSPLIIMKSFLDPTDEIQQHSSDEDDDGQPKPQEASNEQNTLQRVMWQGMFPSLDVKHLKLYDVRRCCLLNRDPATGLIDFRHYAIRVRPIGVSKPVKRLILRKKLPDLGKFHDIDEIFEDGGMSSGVSDGEEDELDTARHVPTPCPDQSLSSKSAIRLVELGPRLTLKLHKVHEGLLGGVRLL